MSGGRAYGKTVHSAKRPRSSAWFKEKLMLAEAQEADCDDISSAKAVLMGNLSSCDSDVHYEVPYSDTYLNDMINQDESQNAGIQDINSSVPNDLLVLSLVEQMTDHVKEKESLSTTLTVFKTECKEKESKYMDNEIVLENQNKELENTLSQQIEPTLYDGSVIAKEHDVISVIDDEETLILEEESRSKMLDKQNDKISIKQKINISPMDYSKLNKIKKDFGKRFVTKKELSAEQAFWLKHSNYNPDTSVKSHTPVRIEAPSHEKRTTSDNITAEEVTEVQTIFNQMEAAVDQCSIDKNAFENQIKQVSIDNDQLLKQIMSQEIMHIASVESSDLNAQLQEKFFAIAALKNELRKLRGKNVVDTVVSKPTATIAPGMFKLDIETISHRLKNNKDAHEVYLENTIENTDTLRGLVEFYVSKTCPSLTKPIKKLVAVTPVKKDKKVRFVEPIISSSNITKQTDSLRTKDSNKPFNQEIKVEEHPRNVKSSLNKKNSISEPISKAIVKHFVRNAKFESMCAICNKRLFDANHDMCLVDYVNDVNVVQIVLWYLDSGCSKHITRNRSQLINFVNKFLGTIRFRNDHIAKIMGYGDYQMGNVTISQVYYVEGLGHNLFSVGQFCDSDLEAAFRKHTCFIRDLEGVDLLNGSRGSNLYTLSMEKFVVILSYMSLV
ncbi:hypothetical protein Tco_0619984 [Tanacetum coccineum]